jgi:hypothetical protein
VNLADKPGGHLDEGTVRAVREISIGSGGIQFAVCGKDRTVPVRTRLSSTLQSE